MSEWAWMQKHLPLALSVGPVLGLAAMLVRAYSAAHGTNGYLLLISGDNFLRAALQIGLEGIVWVTFFGLIVILPMQIAYMYRDSSSVPLVAISVVGVFLLLLLKQLDTGQLFLTLVCLVVVLVIAEHLAEYLFGRFDIGSIAEILPRLEAFDFWGWLFSSRKSRRARRKASSARVKRSRPELYWAAARAYISRLSLFIGFVFVASLITESNAMWLPTERITLANGVSYSGVYVVEESDRWVTTMSASSGQFRRLAASDVYSREFCTTTQHAGERAPGVSAIDC